MNGVKKNQPSQGNSASVTVRFALDLAKPTEEGYEYEYSYEQLLEDKLKVRKEDERSQEKGSTSDPFSNDCDLENLEAIAKRFEEKYGPKKRKRFRDTDLIDRGSGYDVTDSFVDDAELYEDYVPHQLDTKFGGFYVNMGSLEFKTVDDVEEDEMDFIKNKKFKPPKIRKHSSFQTPKVMLATQKLKKAKQMQQKSAAGGSLLKVTPASKLAGRPPISHSQQQRPTTPSHPPAAKKIKLSDTEKSMLSNSSKTNSPSAPVPTDLDSSDIMLSANISKMMSSLPVVNLSKKLAQAEVVGSSGAGSPMGEGSGQPVAQVPKEPPKLPAKLPSLVMDKVLELEQMITQAQGADGRLTIKARMSYDKHLVDIHMRCQGLAVRLKNAVLDYLGYKMGVSRLTLVKRMKQELKREEEVELGKSIADLKRAIDAAIPEQMEAYESDMKARAESLSSQPAVEKLTSEEDSHMEEVFEEHTTGSVSSAPTVSSSAQKKLPRKRFKWNEETKKLLCKAVSVKISCAKKWVWGNKPPPDEVVGNFLDIKIKPLWPKGWMQKSILLKMSESAHKHYTSAAKRAATGLPAKVDGSSPLKSSTSAMSVSMTTGVGVTVAGHPKPAVSTPSSGSPSSAKIIPPTSSAPSLLAGSSDASSIIKELEALKNTSQRNNGKISSGGLGKGLTTTGILGTATNSKKLVAPSKGKLVAISQRSRSPGSVSPKLKKLLPSSKPSPKGLASTQPLTVSAGAVTASGAASTTGSSTAKVTVSKNATPVLKQTAPGSGGSTAVTSTNSVSYLLSKNSVSISQFIQDLQKHQLQQQATPTVTATATITSPHPANNIKSSASNSKMSLSGKAIIAKNTGAPGAKHASPSTAKGKPAGSGSAKLHTSKVISPAGSQISSKQTLPANKQLVCGTLPTAGSSSMVSHSNKQQSSSSKQVVSSGSVGQSQVLTVQGLQKLVNQLTSASSSQSAGVKIALQSAATVQPVKEKTSLSLSSQKAQARVSHKVVATTSSGQSQKVSNLKSGASMKVGGSNVVGAGVDGVVAGGGRHLSGAGTHTNLAVGRTLSSSGASTSSAVVAGKTFSITASRTPVQAVGKTLVSTSAGARPGGATTGKAVPTGSVSTASSGRPLVSNTNSGSAAGSRTLAPVMSSASSGNTAGSVRAAGYGGNSSGNTPAPVRTPAAPVVASSSRTSPVITGSGTSSVASKSVSSGSRTSPAGVTSGRSLPSGAPGTNPVKGTSAKTVFAGNPAGNPNAGNVATGSRSVVADAAVGNNSLGKGGTTSRIVSSAATGFGGVASAGKAPSSGGVVSSSTGVSVIDVGRGKEELVRRINSTGTEPAAAAGNSVSSHMPPPPLITADSLDSDWREHRSGSGDNNVIVISDTPPRPDLPVTNVTSRMSNEQLFIPLSLSPSPSSPMVSPMEQIMEEHSYRTPRSST